MEKEAIRSYSSSERLSHIIRLWLILILIVIPYQTEIMNHVGAWSLKVTRIIKLLDEITVILLFPFAAGVLYRKKNNYSLFMIIAVPLCIFSISALLSGVINDNSLFITGYGIFYYIKYFLLIFIYAAFINSFSYFKKVFKVLLFMTVIVGFVAFIHEVWAMMYHHVFDQSITSKVVNSVNYFLSKLTLDDLQNNLQVRMGLYRTTSLMSHFNLLGFYSLLILTLYLYMGKKINAFYFLCLLSGIYFSMSRVAIIGFLLLGLLQVLKGRRWLVFFMIIPVCALFYFEGMSSHSVLDDSQNVSDLIVRDLQNDDVQETYRQYARKIAIAVWTDHPNLGVGPGMFGGAIAKKTNSPYYEEYNFLSEYFNTYSDLDQFWPQTLAETGIAGTVFFVSLYLFLFIVIFISRKRTVPDSLKNYMTGLIILTVFIEINTLASSLNIVSILYPYCALTGIGLGCSVKE